MGLENKGTISEIQALEAGIYESDNSEEINLLCVEIEKQLKTVEFTKEAGEAVDCLLVLIMKHVVDKQNRTISKELAKALIAPLIYLVYSAIDFAQKN